MKDIQLNINIPYKSVKYAEDMYDVHIGELVKHRGRYYILAEYGGSIYAGKETFVVRALQTGKRIIITLKQTLSLVENEME